MTKNIPKRQTWTGQSVGSSKGIEQRQKMQDKGSTLHPDGTPLSEPKIKQEPTSSESVKYRQEVKYVHIDQKLEAVLSHDLESGVWVVEYYRDRDLFSAALYLSEATAILMMQSLGYKRDCKVAC